MKKKMSSKHMEEYEHMAPKALKKHMKEEKLLFKEKVVKKAAKHAGRGK